jgi:hypothetical protein
MSRLMVVLIYVLLGFVVGLVAAQAVKFPVPSIIATSAALVSSFMAFISWWYNKELSKAAVSLVDVKVYGEKVDKDKLRINFLFLFKNVGKETLKITELRLAHFDFQIKNLTLGDKKRILNPIHAESIFNYPFSFTILIDPQIPDEKIGDILPQIVGKHAIILKLKHKGCSIFSRKETTIRYFLGYEGYGAVYQLTEDEYKEIEEKLPQEFRVGKD